MMKPPSKSLKRFFVNPDVSDADEFSPDIFDGFFNMGIAMDCGDEDHHSPWQSPC